MIDAFHSINCQELSRPEFEARLRREEAKGILRAPDVAPVRVDFNVESSNDIFISIYSYRSGEVPIYYGKLLDAVKVFPDGGVFDRDGRDIFHFKIFDMESSRICTQMQESASVYWERGKDIKIEFLAERELDPDIGTPVGHRVRLD